MPMNPQLIEALLAQMSYQNKANKRGEQEAANVGQYGRQGAYADMATGGIGAAKNIVMGMAPGGNLSGMFGMNRDDNQGY